jgi:Ca2+-binding RTX toxin-like protein
MATIFVSTDGSTTGNGSIERPFASLQQAHDLAKPGDTIMLRGGTYVLTEGIRLTNPGKEGAPIIIQSYGNEKAILDGAGITDPARIDDDIIAIYASWTHVKGLELRNGPSDGITIRGNTTQVTLEALDVHHNGRASEFEGKGIGVFGHVSNSLILNCDSHHNRDLQGDNADGFQIATTGTGVVLRGNRAYQNADDGFDLFNTFNGTRAAAVLIENNWAFDNGLVVDGVKVGDGNGFKLGGQRSGTNTESGGHIVRGNLSFDNRTGGFDENNATLSLQIVKNTAYNNASFSFGFWNRETTLINNLAVNGGVLGSAPAISNSWQLSGTFDGSSVVSLMTAAALQPRLADGSLPSLDLLRPNPNGSAVDRGVAYGWSYNGASPDLGAYETGVGSSASLSMSFATKGARYGFLAVTDASGASIKWQTSKDGVQWKTVDKAGQALFLPIASEFIRFIVQTPSDVSKGTLGSLSGMTGRIGDAGANSMNGLASNDLIRGLQGDDRLHGKAGADQLLGDAGNDILVGGNGDDQLSGGSGNDRLQGGLGNDVLAGASGNDRFVFNSVEELRGDTILGFVHSRDLVDLSGIDANATVTGNQSFAFIGQDKPFTAAGQARGFSVTVDGTTQLFVEINTDADLLMDARVMITGIANIAKADLLL